MTWTRTNGLLSERFSLWHGDKKLYLLCTLYYASCIFASMAKHRTWSSHIYLPEMDCVVLNEAIKNCGEVDQDDLFWHFMSSQIGRSQICSDWWNVDRIVSEMTHRDLVQVPSFVSKTWEKLLGSWTSPNSAFEKCTRNWYKRLGLFSKSWNSHLTLTKKAQPCVAIWKNLSGAWAAHWCGCPASNMLQMRLSVNCSDN